MNYAPGQIPLSRQSTAKPAAASNASAFVSKSPGADRKNSSGMSPGALRWSERPTFADQRPSSACEATHRTVSWFFSNVVFIHNSITVRRDCSEYGAMLAAEAKAI